MPLGDWSKMGVLNNYSGGVRYRTTFTLPEQEAKGKVEIDLGRVIATAEVHINGKKAGVRVAPPWKLDVTGLLQAGENKIEVLVYNTLGNHYQTIPSLYRGDPASGLFGPVRLMSRDWTTGGEFTYRAKMWNKGTLPDEGEQRTRTVHAVNLIGRY